METTSFIESVNTFREAYNTLRKNGVDKLAIEVGPSTDPLLPRVMGSSPKSGTLFIEPEHVDIPKIHGVPELGLVVKRRLKKFFLPEDMHVDSLLMVMPPHNILADLKKFADSLLSRESIPEKILVIVNRGPKSVFSEKTHVERIADIFHPFSLKSFELTPENVDSFFLPVTRYMEDFLNFGDLHVFYKGLDWLQPNEH